jgi:hypothetical protein
MGLFLISCKAKAPQTNYIKECQELIFDLSDGTLNGVKPDQKQSEIKEWLPCYTQVIPDGSATFCGGAVLYANHGFNFYTYLDDYVEVQSDFKGTVTGNLLGKSREEVKQILSEYPLMENKVEESMDFYQTTYGCIRISYKDNKVIRIAAHYTDLENLNWCKE